MWNKRKYSETQMFQTQGARIFEHIKGKLGTKLECLKDF